MRIHLYISRKIRIGEEFNIEITIFSIYCTRARKQGKQYTKRILPAFVTPECNICFANVLEYIRLHPDGSIDYDAASHILGTYDERTIKKHVKHGWKMIHATAGNLMAILSSMAGYAYLPEKNPGETLIEYLTRLISEMQQACIRMGELPAGKKSDIYIHTVYWFEKSRNPVACTLNRVLRNLHFYDTS